MKDLPSYLLPDQGLYNFLVIEVLPKYPDLPVTIINWTGLFTTIGTVPKSMILGVDHFGTVKIEGAPERAIFFHQFDRHPDLYPSIESNCKKYCNDPRISLRKH